MKLTWLKISVAAVTAAAACAYLLKRREKFGKIADRKAGAAQEIFPVIAAGISENAGIFDGLYESLFQAVRNQDLFSTEAFEEWCDRVGQLKDEAFCSAFAQTFSKRDIADEALCRKKMEQLLSCVERADIHRERQSGSAERVYGNVASQRRLYGLRIPQRLNGRA